jgi:hypothetical protein
MSSPETQGGATRPEQQPSNYSRVARFDSEQRAGTAYTSLQETLFNDPGCDLSVYRLLLARSWHVAVLGEQPREDLDRTIRTVLGRGEPATLPEEVLRELERRRAQATKLGPWVERHLRP